MYSQTYHPIAADTTEKSMSSFSQAFFNTKRLQKNFLWAFSSLGWMTQSLSTCLHRSVSPAHSLSLWPCSRLAQRGPAPWGPWSWKCFSRWGLTRAEHRERITSLALLPMLLFWCCSEYSRLFGIPAHIAGLCLASYQPEIPSLPQVLHPTAYIQRRGWSPSF